MTKAKTKTAEPFTVVRDKDTDIAFDGYHIATASSYAGPGSERWTDLTLFQTVSGTYVCRSIGFSDIAGEIDRCSGHVANDIDDVIAWFGHGWLAKQLYQEAGIQAATHVA